MLLLFGESVGEEEHQLVEAPTRQPEGQQVGGGETPQERFLKGGVIEPIAGSQTSLLKDPLSVIGFKFGMAGEEQVGPSSKALTCTLPH